MSDTPERPGTRPSRFTFFRQSGWMLFATTLSGVFFYAVHIFAARMPEDEYGLFATLLQVLNQMAIPAAGIQMIFVQQAALAQTDEHRRELAGALRAVIRATFLLWACVAAICLLLQQKLLADYKIANPLALWATLALGLLSLWMPVVNGTMQGRQNFLWLGLGSIVVALTRLLLMAFFVLALGTHAAGAMVAVCVGMIVGVVIGARQTAGFWRGPVAKFVWRPWLKRVVPLTLGMGAATFMFTFDMIVVRRFLPESGLYGAAGMIGRALMFFVAPMTWVMFPKIVQSAAKAERTDVLAQALGATALLAIGAALFGTFFARIPLLLVQGKQYLSAAPLVPWFTWCVLPLTVSNVLINNLLARQQYKVVPWLVLVAVGYAACLWLPWFHTSHLRVIQTMGAFSAAFFCVCLLFTWRRNNSPGVGKTAD